MFQYLTEAGHIAAGMDIPFAEALELVYAAHEIAEIDEPARVTMVDNVVYGVDFQRRSNDQLA